MTTPLTSTTLPTLYSAIGLLKRRLRKVAPTQRPAAGEREESIEGARLPNALREGAAILRDRGHPGLVVERSAERTDERRHHRSAVYGRGAVLQAQRYRLGPLRRLVTAPNWPTPEPR